ncbi:c-type cytochrome [Trichloromonas sp.]|uniref:c-type cytochrome n=1 Tax=Trichloromonas sp. TaxID=3069249 RepID=UPI002A4430AE|nr:cytochrome c [Trichloromonas sp.]
MFRPCHRNPFLTLLLFLLLTVAAVAADNRPEGETIFLALGCRGCHRLGTDGGSRGPTLDGVGTRLTQAQLRELLTQHDPQAAMPTFSHLTKRERETLLAYLRTL